MTKIGELIREEAANLPLDDSSRESARAFDRALRPEEAAACLLRIGLAPEDFLGAPRTGEALSRLVAAHQRTVPFENLEAVEERQTPSLRIDDLWQKIVQRERGGWCYELNGLFAALLRGLGYRTTAHIANICKNDQIITGPPRHRINLAYLPEGVFFCDVGFGGIAAPGFAPFYTDHALQAGPGGTFVFRPFGAGGKILCQSKEGRETPLMEIEPAPREGTFFLPYNEYSAHDPGSPFIRQAIKRLPEWAG
ncbi:MAG: arylamine N-acetyltransferase [Gracilibacteraceae bacterium]|jgi:N-hydroxyarylamine O-acetyltransferase|nr:arylamine N-acetyltransferase [Gracilibacteraceae bacterium]